MHDVKKQAHECPECLEKCPKKGENCECVSDGGSSQFEHDMAVYKVLIQAMRDIVGPGNNPIAWVLSMNADMDSDLENAFEEIAGSIERVIDEGELQVVSDEMDRLSDLDAAANRS